MSIMVRSPGAAEATIGMALADDGTGGDVAVDAAGYDEVVSGRAIDLDAFLRFD